HEARHQTNAYDPGHIDESCNPDRMTQFAASGDRSVGPSGLRQGSLECVTAVEVVVAGRADGQQAYVATDKNGHDGKPATKVPTLVAIHIRTRRCDWEVPPTDPH